MNSTEKQALTERVVAFLTDGFFPLCYLMVVVTVSLGSPKPLGDLEDLFSPQTTGEETLSITTTLPSGEAVYGTSKSELALKINTSTSSLTLLEVDMNQRTLVGKTPGRGTPVFTASLDTFFSLRLAGPGSERFAIDTSQCNWEASAAAATIDFIGRCDGDNVRVGLSASLRSGSGEIAWQVNWVDSNLGAISEVVFPILQLANAESIAAPVLEQEHESTALTAGSAFVFDIVSPTNPLSEEHASLFDRVTRKGLSFSISDKVGTNKKLRIARNPEKNLLQLSWVHYPEGAGEASFLGVPYAVVTNPQAGSYVTAQK